MKVKIYVRGSSILREEKMRVSFLIKSERGEVARFLEFPGKGSPLKAEYLALLVIFERLKNSRKPLTHVEIYSTNEVMVRQMEGKFTVTAKEIVPVYYALLKKLKGVTCILRWIPKAEMDRVFRSSLAEMDDKTLRILLDRIDFDVSEL